MSDYISRKAVLDLEDDFEWELPDDEIFFTYIDPDKVRNLPAADVRENKIGKWIPIEEDADFFGEFNKCSDCGAVVMGFGNYCSNCGADMRGEQDV